MEEKQIAEEYFGSWCRYRKSFDAYRRLRVSRSARDVRVIVLWGKPGTGKTRIVFESEPELWIAPDPTLQWFDGYCGQSTVLIDDYRGDGKEAFLLRLLDRYPIMVPVKGGFVDWVPTKIFITSNISPPFGHNAIDEALARRVERVIKMDFNIYDEERVHELEYIQTLIQ